jgi:hypothetical protein
VYINFALGTNTPARRLALSTIKNLQIATYGEINYSVYGRIEYLRKLRDSCMVIAPEGNGVDTHRLWETLYMGGTPVVIKSNYLPTEILQLPVILLDSWQDLLDEVQLEKDWHEAQTRRSNFHLLSLKYWLKTLSKSPFHSDVKRT